MNESNDDIGYRMYIYIYMYIFVVPENHSSHDKTARCTVLYHLPRNCVKSNISERGDG